MLLVRAIVCLKSVVAMSCAFKPLTIADSLSVIAVLLTRRLVLASSTRTATLLTIFTVGVDSSFFENAFKGGVADMGENDCSDMGERALPADKRGSLFAVIDAMFRLRAYEL